MRLIRLPVLVCALLALGACATTSGVIPIGNGRYEITGNAATALGTGASEKGRLLNTASGFCEARGKQLLLAGAADNNGKSGVFANANAREQHNNHVFFGHYVGASSASAELVHPGRHASADVVFSCQ